MIFNDDELVPLIEEESSGPKPKAFIAGKTQLTVSNKNKAPFEATPFTVLLELEGYGSTDDTPEVDIVTVLDISGSMRDDNKLVKMKEAMQFLIKKLSRNHRLSVVTFSTHADRKCRLRRMTPEAQKEVGQMVNNLSAGGYTNIAAGLRLALRVLDERQHYRGRVPAIMLMSDGDQDTRWEDARKVGVNNLPVFTFGFGHGKGYDPKVLNIIANNSKGGTFAVANVDSAQSGKESGNELNIAFAKCLGGLLTLVVQNLKLTITRTKPTITITDVSEKSYPVEQDDDSRTISFGHLYHGEKRSVLVDLHLPVAPKDNAGYEALEISYSFDYQGEPFDANPITVSVYRTKGQVDAENPKVKTEQNRVETVGQMQKATDLADNNKFSEAQTQLKQAQDLLEKATLNEIIEVLKSQVSQFVDLMKDPESYKEKGKHIALAILTSHYRQREAATSGDPKAPSLFTTPGAQALVDQAIEYALDPNKAVQPFTPATIEFKPPPPPERTLIERVNDNIAKAIGALQTLVVSLQEIQAALNSTKNA